MSQYNKYVKHLKYMQKQVRNFSNVEDYNAASNKDEISEGDFARYKSGHILPEKEYWQIITKLNNIRKRETNKALGALNSQKAP